MAIRKEILDVLACPKCKGDIIMTEDGTGIICKTCKLRYPVRDDIPFMLEDEAEKIA